jgi:hypothetical protein
MKMDNEVDRPFGDRIIRRSYVSRAIDHPDRTPPPLINCPSRKLNDGWAGDFWQQGSAMGRAIGDRRRSRSRVIGSHLLTVSLCKMPVV